MCKGLLLRARPNISQQNAHNTVYNWGGILQWLLESNSLDIFNSVIDLVSFFFLYYYIKFACLFFLFIVRPASPLLNIRRLPQIRPNDVNRQVQQLTARYNNLSPFTGIYICLSLVTFAI